MKTPEVAPFFKNLEKNYGRTKLCSKNGNFR